MKKIISSLVIASVLFSFALADMAFSKEKFVSDRAEAIGMANNLYPDYIRGLMAGQGDVEAYIRATSKFIFRDANVWKMKSGYILYSPPSGVTFFVVTGSGRLIGLSPSQMLAKTGLPPLEREDRLAEVEFVKVPKAIDAVYKAYKDVSAEGVMTMLQIAGRTDDASQKETIALLNGPYLRARRYATCLDQINNKALYKKIMSDMRQQNMAKELKNGFDYSDFLPLAENAAILVHVAKDNGMLYTLTTVSMDGKCSAHDTRYKLF